MNMAAFGGNMKFKGHDPIIYRKVTQQEYFLPSPLTVQTPTMPDQHSGLYTLTQAGGVYIYLLALLCYHSNLCTQSDKQ